MTRFLLALILTAPLLAQTAARKPYHLGRDIIGEPMIVFLRNNPMCELAHSCYVYYDKNHRASVAGIPLTRLSAEFDVSSFTTQSLDYSFRSDDYERKRLKLMNDLGRPGDQRMTAVGEYLQWATDDWIVMLDQYRGKHESGVSIISVDLIKNLMKQAQEQSVR
jgi:hypothetical protein